MKTLCNAADRHVACYVDVVLCLLKPVLILLCILLPFITYAQDIKLANPSLEGVSSEGNPPASWHTIEKTPDTQPGVYNINLPASDGTSYIGLFCERGLQEAISQQLPQRLDSGKTYYLNFDLAYPPVYYKAMAYASFIIYGGDKEGERTEELWESGAIYNQQWKKYTAVFTPKHNYAYLVFAAYKVQKDLAANSVAVLVDNFSDIKEAIKLDLTSENTCQGAASGGATARILNADDNYTYLWEPSGDTVNNVKGLAAGTYRVSVRSKSGATTYGTVAVGTYNVEATASVVPIDCAGSNNAIISIDAKNGQMPYRFYLNDSQEGSASNIFKHIRSGKYDVKVKDNNGCTATLKNITVQEPAALKVQAVKTTAVSCSGSKDGKIILTASGGNPPYAYGIAGNELRDDNVVGHLDAGFYHYQISDSYGCKTEGNAEITKEWRDCAVFMPNAFSPNRDGLNDVFRAKIQDDVSNFHLTVFGRWGQLIFETKDPAQGWDGTQRNTMQPAGTYLWTVTYTDSKQQAIKQQGSLVLIR